MDIKDENTWKKYRLGVLISILIVFALNLQAYANEAQNSNVTRIVGGNEADDGEYPWQVYLSDDARDFNCGGSIIHSHWILTAAHCMHDRHGYFYDAKDIYVTSATNVRGADKGVKHKVKKIIIHEDYDLDSTILRNDIALLELEKPTSSNAINIYGGDTRRLEKPGKSVVVTGWGETQAQEKQRNSSRNLLEVEVPIVSEAECKNAYSEIVDYDGNVICAGEKKGGKDSCSGDSGGPLISQETSGSWKQIGIVSWGDGCAQEDGYGVYTRVSSYESWINENTGGALQTSPEIVEEETPPPEESSVSKGKRALLVGIEKYQDKNLNLIGGSVNDVNIVRRLLINKFGFKKEQIKVLLDEQATKKNILDAMDNWLVKGSRSGDEVVFAYSGHGYYQKDLSGDESDGFDETLVPYDSKIADRTTSPVIVDNLLYDDEVNKVMSMLSNRKVMLMIDACHSGTMTKSINKSDPRLVRTLAARMSDVSKKITRSNFTSMQREEPFIESSQNLIAWSAVSPMQEALVDTESEQYQGVFTGRFAKGIENREADMNGDGLVTFAEQHEFLLTESQAYCKRHKTNCKYGLTPYLEAPTTYLSRDIVTGTVVEDVQEDTTGLLNHTNSANLSIKLLPSDNLQIGDKMTLRIESDRMGYLLVLDISPEEEITQLYPNIYSEKHQGNSRIVSDKPIYIPDTFYGFEFYTTEPVGKGKIIALITEDPVSLDDLLDPNKDLQVISNQKSFSRNLAERLRRPFSTRESNTTMEWSMIESDYQISR